MKFRLGSSTLLLALVGTAASAADIYKSTAPDGTVSYSDRPLGANAQFVSTVGSRPAARPAASPEAGPPNAAAQEPLPEAPAIPTLPEGPTAAELLLQRQKNCEMAREREQRYTVSRRLYRTNAAGEREYLDDAAVAAARAEAAANVKDWCG
jgi:hypothetical protein